MVVFQTSLLDGKLAKKRDFYVKQYHSGTIGRFLYARIVVPYFIVPIVEPFFDDYLVVESVEDRERLPLYKILPAADAESLTLSSRTETPGEFVDWHRSHGDHSSNRYSRLRQINKTNVRDLQVAWTYRSSDGVANIQANPVIAEGIMYVPTGGHNIAAINALTGKEIWKFKSPAKFPAKRGLVWRAGKDGKNPRIYFSAGHQLIALDARTGQPVPEFGNKGIVDSHKSFVAPVIVNGLVINATFRPSLEAYDLETGKLVWTYEIRSDFYEFLPGKRHFITGRHPWSGMSADIQRGIVFVSTGNPIPAYFGVNRPGDNPGSTSVIAIDVATGKKLWAFQEVRHDLWDADVPAPPVLTTILRHGKKIDVVAIVTKLGNTLLLDRLSGKPVFDFRLRRAPTSNLPGEKTSPYQPDVELPERFARQVFSIDDVTNIGSKNRQSVLDQIKLAKFGFFEPPESGRDLIIYGFHGGAEWSGASVDPETNILYVSSNNIPWKITIVESDNVDETSLPISAGRKLYLENCSVCHGLNREGAEGPDLKWLGRRKSKHDIIDVIRNGKKSMPPATDLSPGKLDDLLGYLLERDQHIEALAPQSRSKIYTNHSPVRLKDLEGYPAVKPPWGQLTAINLNSGKIVWQVPLGEHEALLKRGIPVTGTENIGGATVTAGGLVFVGGTKDLKIRAFDSSNGKELWSHKLPFGGFAPPATYEVNGQQFLVIPATGGGVLTANEENPAIGDTFVAFKLSNSTQ